MGDPSTAGLRARGDGASRQAPPSISLPKGGGAIRGIGEKFATNPVTGTGSLTVPIVTSAGRGELGPHLELAYDSGRGNGPFGFGWNVRLPSITRKTDKGLPAYDDATEADVFLLSDAEDLVPALDPGKGWARDRVEDPPFAPGYRIDRYRPRIEAAFARIERWTRLADGDVHWRSLTRTNVTTRYGVDAASRVADPADPRRVFSWLISDSSDDKGNAIVFAYKGEDALGVDTDAGHERGRERRAGRYLKRILYGNTVSLLTEPDLDAQQWLFEVVLDYGEHDRLAPTPHDAGLWAARLDPFSSYRAGFEVRSHRLCRRVLMFHHFPDEPEVGADCLVRSTELAYRGDQGRGEALGSFLAAVIPRGHRRQGNGYLSRALPPLELEYTPAELHDEVREVDAASLAGMPAGLATAGTQWADMDGDGVAGVLGEQSGAWLFAANLGDARFAPPRPLPTLPAGAALGGHDGRDGRGRVQLMDLTGDGLADLVELGGGAPGFHERTDEGGWSRFKPFRSLPALPWGDANLRFTDLDGDGHADALLTDADGLAWSASLGLDGFGPLLRAPAPDGQAPGPRLLLSDETQSVQLADMSGDGLADLVRVRNGEVAYWPNLGYGRFGAKVVMRASPWLDAPERFDARRVRLADVDGSGVTDIVHLGADGVSVHLNEAGNGFAAPQRLARFPRLDARTQVATHDLLGTGTTCLVWSSPLPGDAGRSLRYVDLMGGVKPHLLVRARNNMGMETRVSYAPSTRFALADRAAGHPWVTRLPFPVHVVERMETLDLVGRNRFATTYSYHHGYFDGPEREFRGFGMVEQRDTEELAALTPAGRLDEHGSPLLAPVLTRTWFHTGAYLAGGRVSKQFEHEYFTEAHLSEPQREAMLLPDTVWPDGLLLADGSRQAHRPSAEELREAARALKGSLLRQEVYALDGPDAMHRPYLVAERNYTVELLQPKQAGRHPVCLTHARESVEFHYERDLADPDPRVRHEVVLALDGFGGVLRSAQVAYGRRHQASVPAGLDAAVAAALHQRQAAGQVLLTEASYTAPVSTGLAWHTPEPAETRTYELVNVEPVAAVAGVTNLLRSGVLAAAADAAGDGQHDLAYEDLDAAGAVTTAPWRRLIEQVRTLYRKADLSGPLELGRLELPALAHESYKLALTTGLLASVYTRDGQALLPDPAAVLGPEGGYVAGDDGRFPPGDQPGRWWVPSGRVLHSPGAADGAAAELARARAHFYVPRRYVNPFGAATTVAYDGYDLLFEQVADPLGNLVSAGERSADDSTLAARGNDYRVMQPALVMDPNRNRSQVAFDALGRVAGVAMMGKPGQAAGDSLTGFVADLDEAVVAAHLADPLAGPAAVLAGATSRVLYDLDAFQRTRDDPAPAPVAAATLARETHAADPGGDHPAVRHTLEYSDGFGRLVQVKAQAEAGAQGQPRWVGTGWAIFNHKGLPVRQYEPFFTATPAFEFAATAGVSTVLFYDPTGRVVANLHPDSTYEKVVFDAWSQASWDVNDTVAGDPRTDADVGGLAGPYLATLGPGFRTWYERRKGGDLGPAEQDAAAKASAHAGTPSTSWVDPLGRPFLVVAHNRLDGVDELDATRLVLDVEGNRRAVADPLGRTVLAQDYDLVSTPLSVRSADAGTRLTLHDVDGQPLRVWDGRGDTLRLSYDALRRPTRLHATVDGGPERLVERTVYGEAHPQALERNLRTRACQHLDGAGLLAVDAHDFKGNQLRVRRRPAATAGAVPDWSSQDGRADADLLAAPPDGLLSGDDFATAMTFDALNRTVTTTEPDGSVVRNAYNEAGLLERVEVRLRGAAGWTPFVTGVDYDARGRHTLVACGNGSRTTYAYDPLTFRMTSLRTRREPADFPDDCPAPPGPPCGVQDLAYTYDPAGNVTTMTDGAQQTVFYNGQVVAPDAEYAYDALYRLVRATGREHIGQLAPASRTDAERTRLVHPHDGSAMRRYTQTFDYDRVGNLRRLTHQAAGGGWTRAFTCSGTRLEASTLGGGQPEPHTYDANGNMTSLAGLPSMVWDHYDRLVEIARPGGELVRNLYDEQGSRVRKTMLRPDGTRRHERLYVGALEVYREYDAAGGTVTLERQSLHVFERDRRVALVETRTAGSDQAPAQLVRYQYDNHVGTACLELDAAAAVVSYEEYHPYGSTAYQGVRSQLETPKRYRFGAKERDEETGLCYHGARFYAPWLARWTAPDPLLYAEQGGEEGPAGRHVLAAAVNPYAGMGDNPVILHDPDGREPAELRKLAQRFVRQLQRAAKDEAKQQAKQQRAANAAAKKSEKKAAANGGGKSGDKPADKAPTREPREPVAVEDPKKGAPKGDAKPPETYKIEILVGGPYKRGGDEHRYGHAALRIVTPASDTTFDYGRYGRTWGRFGSEGEGILNVWSNFQTYIKGENALGRTTTGFSFVVTKEQAEKIQAHFDALTSGRKAILTGSNFQRFRIAADYHALKSNCTTLTLGGAEAAVSDLEAAAGPFNKGNGMSTTERIAARVAGWPSRIFMPADLQKYLESKDFEAQLTKLGLGKPTVNAYKQ